MEKEKRIDRNKDSKIIAEDIFERLEKVGLKKLDFEKENLLGLIDELRSSYPELNHHFLYNITLADIYRIMNEHNSSFEFDLTVSEPLTTKLQIDSPEVEAEDKKEKGILLLLVFLLFLHQSHLVLNITFKRDKNRLVIPFYSYFSFLSRNSVLVTSNQNQTFGYVISVESVLYSYSKKEYHFNDQIDRLLQRKINGKILCPESLLNHPVASDLQKHETLYKNSMKIAESLAERLANKRCNIFKLNSRIRLF